LKSSRSLLVLGLVIGLVLGIGLKETVRLVGSPPQTEALDIKIRERVSSGTYVIYIPTSWYRGEDFFMTPPLWIDYGLEEEQESASGIS